MFVGWFIAEGSDFVTSCYRTSILFAKFHTREGNTFTGIMQFSDRFYVPLDLTY